VTGAYTATLTVHDRSGNLDTASVAITVSDTQAPTALGGGDRAVNEGQPAFFDAGASMDNVGVTTYEWDFGDGATSSEAAVSHDYAAPGTYDVTLTVWDAAGNTNTVTMSVEVRAVSPKASELLAAIQGLWAAVMVLAILLVIVGLIAIENYRKGWPKKAPASASQEMPHLPPPPAPPTG
jgi:PKD repeat protein